MAFQVQLGFSEHVLVNDPFKMLLDSWFVQAEMISNQDFYKFVLIL